MAECHVKIFLRGERGELIPGDDYDLPDFAVPPVVGDIIVDPGVPQGLNRGCPGRSAIWIVLIVTSRRGTKEEGIVINN